ncbi:hypothetical protein EG19_02090 [Thermoanaerobaculum aquaticum]|uniref:PD-(D/E)XK endonuclease-like domain-containing protein n=1 Tax=Thermoanaerobaculum aquaticum TaxID=1312852 RepID=A0A062Y0U6_9BACT|nr:PD-(D/E)XK nuclease family protein [Thermoanaerobaculum aquaticum]KDA54011.1 hypothetical protein EG19_02090 [Thermoanaerobaculum aquaticum]
MGAMPGPRCVSLSSPLEAEDYMASKLQSTWAGGFFSGSQALVVVPSRSVREGLVQALLQRRTAWLGVEVRTLQGVAYSVLQQAGFAFRSGEPLFPVVVSRVAQAFQERYGFLQLLSPVERVQPLVATVRDLLDAGFSPDHLEAACELIDAEVKDALGERATALLQVAAAVDGALRTNGVFRRNDALSLATHLLKTRGASPWPARPLLVYGFADVTGVAADFLEALLAASDGELVLVQPPDPIDRQRGAGEAFLSRLLRRVPGVESKGSKGPSPLSQLSLWEAPELEAEIRWVAEDIKKQIAAGVKPERIGVVARSLEPYALAVRQCFSALGVPFSAYQPAPAPPPLLARMRALVGLAAEGLEAPVSRLLSAIPRGDGKTRALASALLRLSGAVGARTAGQLVERAPGLLQEQGNTALFGQWPASEASAWLSQLQTVLVSLGDAPSAAGFGERLRALAALCDPGGEAAGVLADALPAVSESVGNLSLSRRELCFLLSEELRQRPSLPLGGNGGGVAVLSAMEARFRTFERLYLVGLQRDIFPRVPREDPLLPDHVRQKLAVLLPDIPLAERGASEERYLFGLLLASAPSVWLSWPAHDPDGRPLARSPFVDELVVAYPELSVQRIPGRQALVWGGSFRPAPAGEWAVYAGLHEDAKAWRAAFQLALEKASATVAETVGFSPGKLTEARQRVLREWDPPPWEAKERALSPYLGFLGPSPWVEETTSLWAVTSMEAYAQCPWKTFVERVLRLQNLYAGESEGTDLTPRLLGDVVHGVLERILKAHLQEQKRRQGEGESGQGSPLQWPSQREFIGILKEVTNDRLRRVGVVYPGLMLALFAAAQPFLAVARRLLVEGELGNVVASEGSGWIETGPGSPQWHFRFDAAVQKDGVPVLLDFKTGSPEPYVEKKTELAARVRRGELLQGAVYATATGSIGCYVFLQPDWDKGRVFPITDSPVLRKAVVTTFQAFFTRARWGVFFPRLFDPVAGKEPDACERCQVRLACSRGESGARRRLKRWGETAPTGGPAAELAWRHWWLPKEN